MTARAKRIATDLRHLQNVIARLNADELTLDQIEEFERYLMAGHRKNLLKIDTIIDRTKRGLL